MNNIKGVWSYKEVSPLDLWSPLLKSDSHFKATLAGTTPTELSVVSNNGSVSFGSPTVLQEYNAKLLQHSFNECI